MAWTLGFVESPSPRTSCCSKDRSSHNIEQTLPAIKQSVCQRGIGSGIRNRTFISFQTRARAGRSCDRLDPSASPKISRMTLHSHCTDQDLKTLLKWRCSLLPTWHPRNALIQENMASWQVGWRRDTGSRWSHGCICERQYTDTKMYTVLKL